MLFQYSCCIRTVVLATFFFFIRIIQCYFAVFLLNDAISHIFFCNTASPPLLTGALVVVSVYCFKVCVP